MPDGLPPLTSTGEEGAHLTGLPAKPIPASTTMTYSSAPVLRDLKKEAAVFLPAAVRQQKKNADAIQKIQQDAEKAGIEVGGSAIKVNAAPQVNAAPDLIDAEYEQFRQELGE